MSFDTHSPRKPASGDPERYIPDPAWPLDDQPNPSASWGITSWFHWAVEIDPSDGLTLTSTAHHEIAHRTVTAEQLRTFAFALLELAVRASLDAAAEVPPTPSAAVTTEGLVA